jgi:hypothetical protein
MYVIGHTFLAKATFPDAAMLYHITYIFVLLSTSTPHLYLKASSMKSQALRHFIEPASTYQCIMYTCCTQIVRKCKRGHIRVNPSTQKAEQQEDHKSEASPRLHNSKILSQKEKKKKKMQKNSTAVSSHLISYHIYSIIL